MPAGCGWRLCRADQPVGVMIAIHEYKQTHWFILLAGAVLFASTFVLGGALLYRSL
jgi:hypothetical protein